MIIQSNIAQPQVVRRDQPLDRFLERLTGLAGAAANIYQSYSISRNSEAARRNAIATVLRDQMLSTDEMKIALTALGASPEIIAMVEKHRPDRPANVFQGEAIEQDRRKKALPEWSKYYPNLYPDPTQSSSGGNGPIPALAPFVTNFSDPNNQWPPAPPNPQVPTPLIPKTVGPQAYMGGDPRVSNLVSRLSSSNSGNSYYSNSQPMAPPEENYYGIFPAV